MIAIEREIDRFIVYLYIESQKYDFSFKVKRESQKYSDILYVCIYSREIIYKNGIKQFQL